MSDSNILFDEIFSEVELEAIENLEAGLTWYECWAMWGACFGGHSSVGLYPNPNASVCAAVRKLCK